MNHCTITGWKAIEWINGGLSVRVAPSIGGRILSLEWRGTELLFTQPEHRGELIHPEKASDPVLLKKKLGFRLWGGDKTWVAPQSTWFEGIPPLDLDAGNYAYEADANQIHLSSPLCRETGVTLDRRIRIEKEGHLSIKETLTNRSKGLLKKAPWNVTQFLRPFDVYIPVPTDRVIPYEAEGDSVLLHSSVVKKASEDWSKIACETPAHFKFGALPDRGVIVAHRSGKGRGRGVAHVRKFHVDRNGEYAHGQAIEVYNSPSYDYLEIEVHPPVRPLAPGESIELNQEWFFMDWDREPNPEEILASIP